MDNDMCQWVYRFAQSILLTGNRQLRSYAWKLDRKREGAPTLPIGEREGKRRAFDDQAGRLGSTKQPSSLNIGHEKPLGAYVDRQSSTTPSSDIGGDTSSSTPLLEPPTVGNDIASGN